MRQPMKNVKKRRDITVGVRFNSYEYKRLVQSCEWTGRTLSDFVRRAVLRRLQATRPGESVELSAEKNQSFQR